MKRLYRVAAAVWGIPLSLAISLALGLGLEGSFSGANSFAQSRTDSNVMARPTDSIPSQDDPAFQQFAETFREVTGLNAILPAKQIDSLLQSASVPPKVETVAAIRDQLHEALIEALVHRDEAGHIAQRTFFIAETAEGKKFRVPFSEGKIGFDFFTRAPIVPTGRPNDIALLGDGFFSLRRTFDGELFYSRAGDFQQDADGFFLCRNEKTLDGETVTQRYDLLVPTLLAVEEAIVEFAHPEGLTSNDGIFFRATNESGPPHPPQQAETPLSTVGALRLSNGDAEFLLDELNRYRAVAP